MAENKSILKITRAQALRCLDAGSKVHGTSRFLSGIRNFELYPLQNGKVSMRIGDDPSSEIPKNSLNSLLATLTKNDARFYLHYDDPLCLQECFEYCTAPSLGEPSPGETTMSEQNQRPPQMTTSYNYHKPSPEGLEKITKIREAYTNLDTLVQELCPHTRQRSIALTELETSAMWAIKAVVVNDPESTIEPFTKE